MTFSTRVPANLAENRLARVLADLRRRDEEYIDLTESNPTRAGITYPPGLLESLSHPRGLHYAPEPLGATVAREAVVADFARRGMSVPFERVVLTASTSEAYSLLFKLLCDAGDEVLVPQPSYPLFEHLTRLDAVSSVPYRLVYHGWWSIDLESVARAISPRTRALLLVNPNNPTGSFVSAGELAGLAEVCATHGIALISDEVFADYPLPPRSRPAAELIARDDVLGFTLGGLSKSVGLPQVKLGWMVVSGPVRMVAEALARLELVCDTYLSVSTPVQLAAPALLRDAAVVRSQILARITANHMRCEELVAACPGCSLLEADGGWSAVLRVPNLESEEDLIVTLLETYGVLVHPGYFFDFDTQSFLVVSLLPREDQFRRGLTQVLDHLRRSDS